MITVEEALKKVVEYLRTTYANRPYELVVMEALTREEDIGWLFFFNTREFVETGDMNAMLGGNAPLFVERQSGALRTTGTAHAVEHYLAAIRNELAAAGETPR